MPTMMPTEIYSLILRHVLLMPFLFDKNRNYLGMVLLLKNSQNGRSGNDLYRDKLDNYAMSDIIWNELLTRKAPRCG